MPAAGSDNLYPGSDFPLAFGDALHGTRTASDRSLTESFLEQ